MSDKPPAASPPPVDEDRRHFLASCGRFAVITPPAMALILSTTVASDAIARSSAGNLSRGYLRAKEQGEEPLWVMVVESDGRLRDLAVEELRRAGFEVVEAKDGEEAIDLLKQGQRADALFTAIRLKGLVDGWQVAAAGREIRPAMAVVYATAYSPSQAPVRGSLFVERPYKSNQVAMTVRAVTGRRGAPVVTALAQ